MNAALHVEAFTTDQVADAIGAPRSRLASWLQRDFALVSTAHENPGTGRMRLFTLGRALQIALAAKLIGIGIDVKRASTLALQFSDIGFGGADSSDPDVRDPGGLYRSGDTVFRVMFFADGNVQASVDRARAIADSPFLLGSRRADSVVLIDLEDLVPRVTRRLTGHS